MIEFQNLSKSYTRKERPALENVTLSVKDGEIVGLVGLNGAGKTTMIRVAAGLAFPTSGTVRHNGHDIVSQKVAASETLGIVPEFPNFEPSGRAFELLEYLGGYNGLGGDDFTARAASLLTSVGLGGNEWRRVGTFSQGMKKRFALAAALLANPRNLLLDEILNGLDPEGIRYIRHLLLELKSRGASILLSSHILTEVESVADRIAVLHEGRLVHCVSLAEIHKSRGVRLRIVLRNATPDHVHYLESLGAVQREGSLYTVESPSAEPWTVTAELVRRGGEVAEIRTEREDLEDYFFRTIGELR